MRFHIRFDRVPQASNNQGELAVIRGRAPSLAAPARRMVGCLLAAALLPLAPGHARAAEPEAAADQGAPLESIAQASREPALTSDQALPERWNLHGQFTLVKQYHPSFTSPCEGPNSLSSARNGEETTDLTLFAGIRLWNGGTFYVNPEIDKGFGLSDTLGVAGFPSGEAYKVGKSKPYLRLHRAFLRQVFDLGGASQTIDPSANEVGGVRSADNVTLTVGKFSVVDIFDTNSYAHDSRGDFLNWSVINAAAFDYAADAWVTRSARRRNGRDRGGRSAADSSISRTFPTVGDSNPDSGNTPSSANSKVAMS